MSTDYIGKYKIQRRLGVGGMGSVYLAHDPDLDRLVALKLLKEDFQEDQDLRERFAREARAVARLRHPNVIYVIEIGESDGRPFMAMEYIAGETLAHLLRRNPPLPLTSRLALVEDLCAGLAHAHAAGVIHRDIKPPNIMIDGDGVLKILDFGIARLGNSGMTLDGTMMGSVNYMSPEQITGYGVDYRTDIFSTGAVLYEVIAFEQAFPGGIDTGVLHRISNEGPVPLEQRVSGVDPELAGVVRRALERDPGLRHHTARDLGRDLARIRRRLATEEQAVDAPNTVTTIRPKFGAPGPGDRQGDSDRPRRLDPGRRAELQRQQVEEHLRFAREAVARGDHEAAIQHAERAATVDPDSHQAYDVIDRAKFEIEARAIRQLLAEAERQLADGQLEDAAALAEEAGVTLPNFAGAEELRDEVRRTTERVAAAREREQRIGTSLGRARASVKTGGYETALRAVYEVLAIDPEQVEARELEQTAKAGLQAQRERERARRDAYDRLTSARALSGAGKHDEAIVTIRSVVAPTDTVRIAAADALATVLKFQREAAHAVIVAEARAALARGEFESAVAGIRTIPVEDRTADARTLEANAEQALNEQRESHRKRQALEGLLASVGDLMDADALAPALERLEEANRLGLDDARIPALRKRITESIVAVQEQQQREARDRLATKKIEWARQLLTNGEGYAAIALLERDGTGHALVEEALRNIRAAVAEQEERVRQEAERQRREEEAQRRAEIEAQRRAQEQRAAEEQRRREDEERALERARLQRRDELTALVSRAEQALATARTDLAIPLLQRLGDIESVGDADLIRRAADATALAERQEQERLEARRREEEARQRAEDDQRREADVSRKLEKARDIESHAAALVILREALALAPSNPRVQVLVRERTEALAAERAEAERRRVEAVRAAEAEQRAQEARRQEDEVTRILVRAKAETSPAAARAEAKVFTPALKPAWITYLGAAAGVAVAIAAVAYWSTRTPESGPAPPASDAAVPEISEPVPVNPPVRTPVPEEPAAPAPRAATSGGTPPAVPASPVVKGNAPTADEAGAVPAAANENPEVPLLTEPGPIEQPTVPPAIVSTPNTPTTAAPEPPVVPAAPPAPNTPDQSADRAAIQQLLMQYVAAYERLDERTLRALDPSFPGIRGRELIRTVRLTFSRTDIRFAEDGMSATVRAIGSYSYEWNRARMPTNTPESVNINWTLRKVASAWVVTR